MSPFREEDRGETTWPWPWNPSSPQAKCWGSSSFPPDACVGKGSGLWKQGQPVAYSCRVLLGSAIRWGLREYLSHRAVLYSNPQLADGKTEAHSSKVLAQGHRLTLRYAHQAQHLGEAAALSEQSGAA
uniref:Uncharacterized protein n=1 Tax=Pipistrellus kuhlii TaxID=59472 RepID=A0A7J7VBS7_PIPKU|nr:hypothetical protein mPipKuh1_008471 [Pipistrellus kuhlii]